MASISELYPKAKKLVYDIEVQINHVEKGRASSEDVESSLERLSSLLDDLDDLAKKERPSQRENWRRKLKELTGQKDFLDDQLSRYLKRINRKGRERRERDELMARRNSSLSSGAANDYSQENSSLLRSSKMVGEYLYTGREALSNLIGQKYRLKNVQRKVFDIANLMGLSNSILKMSEKREKIDKIIIFVGMVLITCLLWFSWSKLK
mmetsp:Transcript_20711/g.30645  ORF Transcript_20711/g.30645 Transcript_20711/m.30645 type:complete len:208 (-) Transcript_20711:34-657(-)